MFARFLLESPIVIVSCGDKGARFNVVDVSIAMQQMVLAAISEGLGTCWIGDFDEKVIRELLMVPEKFGIVCLLALGYPRENLGLTTKLLGTRSRKRIESIVSYEKFGNSLAK